MPIDVVCKSGFSNAEHAIGTLSLTPQEVQTACSLFGSNYILRMGLHYQRYVLGGYLPSWQVVRGIYTAANPAPILTTKTRATAVTGNIGESILSLVARRMLGARVSDVVPLNVDSRSKSPDFRLRLRPTFPQIFQSATTLTPATGFDYWPAESKASVSEKTAITAVKTALAQLGTYWYMRRHLEPAVVGYGIVCCFIYKGTIAKPQQKIRLYVFAPSNQQALQQRIDHFQQSNDDRAGFLAELATPNSQTRGFIQHGN